MEIGINSDSEEIIAYEKDGFSMSINKSKLQQGILQMSIEKTVESEKGSFSIGFEMECKINDDFYAQIEEISADKINEYNIQFVKENKDDFPFWEEWYVLSEPIDGLGFYGRFVDVLAGTPSIGSRLEQSISDSVESKIKKDSLEGENE